MRTHPILTTCALLAALALAAAAGAEPFRFRLVATSGDGLSRPHDLVLSAAGNRLYVADTGNDRIAVLDATTLDRVSSFGETELSQPLDVTFDRLGRLLVADSGNDRIAVYEIDRRGARLTATLEGVPRRPAGVDVHPDGRLLVTGATSGEVAVFVDGRRSARSAGFTTPHDIQVDGRGDVWVADSGAGRIVRLDGSLSVARVLQGEDFDLQDPRYLEFDSGERLFVSDAGAGDIKVVDRDGALLQTLKPAGTDLPSLEHPQGVEVRSRDAWISDSGASRVLRYRIHTRIVE